MSDQVAQSLGLDQLSTRGPDSDIINHRNDLSVPVIKGLTPLIGRESEANLLFERWARVKEGMGQAVLLSGEGGIGKSRLIQTLQDHIAGEKIIPDSSAEVRPILRILHFTR